MGFKNLYMYIYFNRYTRCCCCCLYKLYFFVFWVFCVLGVVRSIKCIHFFFLILTKTDVYPIGNVTVTLDGLRIISRSMNPKNGK